MLQQFQYSQCSIYCVKGLQYTVSTNYSEGTRQVQLVIVNGSVGAGMGCRAHGGAAASSANQYNTRTHNKPAISPHSFNYNSKMTYLYIHCLLFYLICKCIASYSKHYQVSNIYSQNVSTYLNNTQYRTQTDSRRQRINSIRLSHNNNCTVQCVPTTTQFNFLNKQCSLYINANQNTEYASRVVARREFDQAQKLFS